jgi:hypothetical protein
LGFDNFGLEALLQARAYLDLSEDLLVFLDKLLGKPVQLFLRQAPHNEYVHIKI